MEEIKIEKVGLWKGDLCILSVKNIFTYLLCGLPKEL